MPGALAQGERQRVLSIVEGRLTASRSSIMDAPERIAQLRAQIAAVLDDVDAHLRSADAGIAATTAPGEAKGHAAASRIPPIESLHAAEILFEAALDVIVASRPERAMPITVHLHRSITERLTRSAAAYVNALLHQVRGAEQAERKRLARELHDRAAYGVGVALRSLDEFEAEGSRQGGQRLEAARAAMHDAVDTIRTIATELRDTLGNRELSTAVACYLAQFAPPGLRTEVQVVGELDRLPAPVAQELYLVLREAVHNTLLHARARSIKVGIAFTESAVSAEVRDDGVGFDLASATGTGLTAMRERLELIGGTLTLISEPDRGSCVRVVIPLTDDRPR